MFPAQTSLIPIQIALARFLESLGGLGINILSQNYPYWYLGTTPFRYLTGPISPFLLVGIHKIFPQLSLFTIYYLLITIAWLFGSLGVYLLVSTLMNADKRRSIAILAALFYLLGPIVPLLFRFSDGLYLMSFSFLPFILLLYARFLKHYSRRSTMLLGGLLSFLLLLNISIIPTLFIGMAAIFLAVTGWGQAEEKLKRSLLLTVYCLLFTTLWYTPGFWLARLGVPSLAGRGLLQVLFDLGKLLPAALAIAAAFISVKFFKERNLLRDFCFYWLFIFGFLTLMRFISDPDFWLDWSSYHVELQMGIAIALGLGLTRMKANIRQIYANALILFAVSCLLFAVIFSNSVIGTLQKDITPTVEYRIGRELSELVQPGERVLLSGTTVFWLNAFFDISQVRGGVDQASVDPNWREAVWEIREGTEPGKSLRWLRDLDISYLVVHTKDSEEYYHDFAHPEKFEGADGLENIYDEGGDIIYRVK